MTLRPYLLGVKVDLNIDHSSSRWLMNITNPSGRLLRWRLRLSLFHFAINYKKGSRNLHADEMSRLSTLGETTIETDYEIQCFTVESSDTDKDEEVEFLEYEYSRLDCFLAGTSNFNERLLVQKTIDERLRSQLND